MDKNTVIPSPYEALCDIFAAISRYAEEVRAEQIAWNEAASAYVERHGVEAFQEWAKTPKKDDDNDRPGGGLRIRIAAPAYAPALVPARA